jgi:hypothetical protein
MYVEKSLLALLGLYVHILYVYIVVGGGRRCEQRDKGMWPEYPGSIVAWAVDGEGEGGHWHTLPPSPWRDRHLHIQSGASLHRFDAH